MAEFIHLHNHSHYSLLDGAATIDGLIGAAKRDAMPALALTDHGVMFGAVEFSKAAHRAGIKPILGCEVYIVTRGSRFDREVDARSMREGRGRNVYHHLVLLAKNPAGYKNLITLCTLGHTEGFYYKPRIDMELLRRYSDGLVALSACPSGVVAAHLVTGDHDEARRVAGTFREVFGGDFYLEIQNHSLDKEKPILAAMPGLARDLDIRLIATNDVHYIEQDHAVAHNVMLLIPDAGGANVSDYRQLRYQTDQIYFKTASQMCELFRDHPEAIRSTLEVAEKIEDFDIRPKQAFMPHFPLPDGVSSLEQHLETLTSEGLRKRYGDPPAEVRSRAEYELGVIRSMGYAGYFLITHDFIRAARDRGIMVGPGRGSAAGSIVSYALGITNVDPLRHGLLFERFLNPDRVSMPDIDIDFSDAKRDEVIEYVKEKYGADSVSQIITFGTLSSRAVLKDVGRVLGVPLHVTESITKQIPVVQGTVTPLAEAIEKIPDLKWVKESKDEKIRELIRISLVLEGMNRNSSTHAAGVVIAPGPLRDYVPLYKTPQTPLMTQYNMVDLEEAGLLKMDFLGLRTLTVIENALALIRENHGSDIDIDALPLDDAATFGLFSRGHTVGIFQFESVGMQDWLRKLKPTVFSDLVAMNALYRPGPMEMIGDFIRRKQGHQKIDYLHPDLEPILRETYGVIVYQEQVIRIASEIAGFSLAKADLTRRAMGKKDRGLMSRQKIEFIEGAVKKGHARRVSGEIFDMIEKFASYGFNKSHSVAYSVVAYQTAYLKAHYPAEYMAAAISAEIGDTDYVVKLIDECKKMQLRVLPPDVNESGVQFVVIPGGLRFGLSAIKNVGVSAVGSIIAKREEGGRFTNLFDFCARVDLRLVNKKTIEALIQAGSFDGVTPDRSTLFAAVEKAIHFGQEMKSQSAHGQSSLFESPRHEGAAHVYPQLPKAGPWTDLERLANEKSVLGFYISGHPMRKYEREVESVASARFGDAASVKPGITVRVCGIITDVKKKIDKRGNQMAFLTMADFTGKGECIVFADAFRQYQAILAPESMVMVSGKADPNGDLLRVVAAEIVPIDRVRDLYVRKIVFTLRAEDTDAAKVSALKKICDRHRGKFPCQFDLREAGAPDLFRFRATTVGVSLSDEFLDDVTSLIGADCVRLSQ
ncbi:MAG TPA: DNA polymerase III subunit alpha [Bacteroidota bacterium]|nr:DNA polymerase III subunit alpha [Bacteroidota bacterium]